MYCISHTPSLRPAFGFIRYRTPHYGPGFYSGSCVSLCVLVEYMHPMASVPVHCQHLTKKQRCKTCRAYRACNFLEIPKMAQSSGNVTVESLTFIISSMASPDFGARSLDMLVLRSPGTWIISRDYWSVMLLYVLTYYGIIPRVIGRAYVFTGNEGNREKLISLFLQWESLWRDAIKIGERESISMYLGTCLWQVYTRIYYQCNIMSNVYPDNVGRHRV